MATNPKSPEGRTYGYRRGAKMEPRQDSTQPTRERGEPMTDDGGILYVCKRYECLKHEPFELKGVELDDPLCPHCKKGNKLEKYEDDFEPKPRSKRKFIALGLLACTAAGLTWWLMRPNTVHSTPQRPDTVPAAPGAPIAALNPETVTWGEVQVASSASRNITISNGGAGDLLINGMELSCVSDKDLPGTWMILQQDVKRVPAKESRDAIVTFKPEAAVAYTGVLKLTTNDPRRPVISICLEGTGKDRLQPPSETTPSEPLPPIPPIPPEPPANPEKTVRTVFDPIDNRLKDTPKK